MQFHVAVERAKELAIEPHFVVAQSFFSLTFEIPDADLTPVGRGHLADEKMLHLGLWLEGFVEEADEVIEAVARFSFEDDGAREQAVAGAVAGGAEFAFRGDGSARVLSVGSRCGGALFAGLSFVHSPGPPLICTNILLRQYQAAPISGGTIMRSQILKIIFPSE